MNTSSIKQQLNVLREEAITRGLARPRFKIEIENDCQYYGTWSWEAEGRGTYDSIFSDSIGVILTKFRSGLYAVGSKEERERNEYLKRLASTIEYGRSIGIDENFINPLAMQMKELSANVIEHKPSPRDEFDDVPF
jgi:hypothetical protein